MWCELCQIDGLIYTLVLRTTFHVSDEQKQ